MSWSHAIAVVVSFFFFQAEDGIRDLVRSRGLGDVYKRQGLRRYLTTPAPSRDTPVDHVPMLALDFETTGLDAEREHIISAGMVDVDGLTIPLGTTTNFYVNPGRDVGQSAVIHQITDDELADAIPTEEAVDRVFDRLAGRVLLAHRAAIEVGCLTSAVRRLYGVSVEVPAVDTMGLGHRALGFDEDHPRDALRLWKLRARAGLPRYRGHDAVVDALPGVAKESLGASLLATLDVPRFAKAFRFSEGERDFSVTVERSSLMGKRPRAGALEDGVTLTAPETVFFALDTFIGRDAVIGPNVIFGPGVTIESGAEIKGFCHLEGCHVSRGADVGPFALSLIHISEPTRPY